MVKEATSRLMRGREGEGEGLLLKFMHCSPCQDEDMAIGRIG